MICKGNTNVTLSTGSVRLTILLRSDRKISAFKRDNGFLFVSTSSIDIPRFASTLISKVGYGDIMKAQDSIDCNSL